TASTSPSTTSTTCSPATSTPSSRPSARPSARPSSRRPAHDTSDHGRDMVSRRGNPRRRWELLDEVATRLDAAGVPDPDVDARWIVDAMVDRFGPDLVSCDAGVLDALVERRAAREPLQLVLGHTTFRW